MQTRMEELRKQAGAELLDLELEFGAMATVAETVGRMIRSPVTHETGLAGKYSVGIALMAGSRTTEN
jgi:hypothetical protein